MRLLISGTGGFIGSHLARRMSCRGHEVVALFRQTRPISLARQPGVRLEQIDLAHPGRSLAGPYDAILHCAAAIPSVVRDENDLMRINVEGARRLFDSDLLSDSPVIIFCSSMSVYGRIDQDVVDESTAVCDPSPYGRSKLECERLLHELSRVHRRLRALSIRLPGVVGAGSHDNFLSDSKARLAAGEPIIVRNPEALFNNVLHIDDLDRFIQHLLDTLPAGHRVTTLASEHPLPIREVVEILHIATGQRGEVQYARGGRTFLISNENARSLGYVPASVRDSVERFAAISPQPGLPSERQSHSMRD